MSGKIYVEAGGKQIKKIYLKTANGEVELKKGYSYPGNRNVFSSGHIVVYHIDTNNVVNKEVDDGADCISNAPSAAKSGWTFHGWREDTVASSTTIPSKTCNADNIHLYAVFKQTVTVTLYNNSATATKQTGSKYYNNGNIANPSFAPVVASVSGWNIRGWSTGSGASAAINYNSGASFTTGSNITLYASWSKTVTVSYNGNGATSGSTANSTGTAYRNYKGDVTNASITLRANGYARYGYNFTGKWALGSSGGTQYSVGTSVTLASSTTFYACWKLADKVITFNKSIAQIGQPYVDWGLTIDCTGYNYAKIDCNVNIDTQHNNTTGIVTNDIYVGVTDTNHMAFIGTAWRGTEDWQGHYDHGWPTDRGVRTVNISNLSGTQPLHAYQSTGGWAGGVDGNIYVYTVTLSVD